jgi:hypothetical protein
VVQSATGGVRLASIVVDEGFGSLDPEARDATVRFLEELQQGGRLVRVMSYAQSLRNAPPCAWRSSQAGPVARRDSCCKAKGIRQDQNKFQSSFSSQVQRVTFLVHAIPLLPCYCLAARLIAFSLFFLHYFRLTWPMEEHSLRGTLASPSLHTIYSPPFRFLLIETIFLLMFFLLYQDRLRRGGRSLVSNFCGLCPVNMTKRIENCSSLCGQLGLAF